MTRMFLMTALVVWLRGFTVAADDSLYVAKVYTDSAGVKLPYRLLVPADYDAKQRYPLVLFLHGAGERGADNKAQLIHGTKVFTTPENRKKYPTFVVVPQCANGHKWVEVDWSADSHKQPKQPSVPMRLTLELLSDLQKEYSIDAKRLYVTGLSMGGYGTWDLLARHPKLFAAGAPVCGGGDPATAAKFAKTPVWAFHGALDGAVKPKRSHEMIAALKKAGAKPRYTEYDKVGHNSWDNAYADPELLKWLFAQKLP